MDNTEEAPPWTPPSPDSLSAEFPNLEIRSLLAVGGMSAVYLVRQLSLDRLAVLKLLPSEIGTDAEAVTRFQTEARALASVRDSGVVEVYDFGSTAGGYLYLLLEYEAGGDLRGWVRKRGRPVTPEEILDIGVAVTGGIAAAHRKGIIHGDIKPDNIFLDDRGRLKVGDFGLAGSSGSSTATHHTPGYTAPEILAGYRLSTPQSDLYAVGASLFELLLGSPPPEDAASRFAALDAVPRAVAEVLAWALKEDPAERPASAEDFQQALLTARTRLAEASAPKPKPAAGPAPVVVLQQSAQGRRRGKSSSGNASAGKSNTPLISAAVLVVLIGGGYFLSRPASPASKTATSPTAPESYGASESKPPPSVAFTGSDASAAAPPSIASVGGGTSSPATAPNSTPGAAPATGGPQSTNPTAVQAGNAVPSTESNTAFGTTGPAATSGVQTVMNDLNGKPAGGENPDDAWLEEGTEKLTGAANTDASSSVPLDARGKVMGVPATDAELIAWDANWKINAPRGTTDDAARISTKKDGTGNVLILSPFSQTVPATMTRQMSLLPDKPMQLSVRVRNKPVSTADWILKAFANDQPLSPPSEISIHQSDRQYEELTWDLSPWKGKKVTLRLESHAGGTNPWIWEHSYWSWIKVEPLGPVLAHAKYNPADAARGFVEPGFVDLFSPAQAPSWRATEINGGLSFEGGVATVYTKPGTPRKGLIWFPKRMFRDFVLRADFKMDTDRADSGIFLRIPEPGKAAEPSAASDSGEGPVELEIRGYSVSHTGTGSLAAKNAPTTLPLNRNDWNRYEITVVGSRYLVKLNGVLINEYNGGSGEPGYLALQNARTDGDVQFRNVWIKELTTPAAAQAAVLTQPAGGSAETPATSKKRPLGVPAEAREFQGKWYRYYPEKLLWRMAKKRCEDLRGHLAKVPDAATNQFLTELCSGAQAWLGASDEKTEGKWVWLDGTPMDYKNWGDGQPDNKHDREDFLGLWTKGTWNDAPNDHPEIRGFLCEWE